MDLDEDETIRIPLRPPLQDSSAPRDDEPVGDLAKLQQWQDERMQRRLRGEYESAVTHLAELITESTERPARLVSIRVDGARRTRPSFLDTLLHPFLHPSQAHGLPPFSASNASYFASQAPTVGGALHAARAASAQLLRTDVFSAVQPRLEASRSPFAAPGDVELVLRAQERGWLFAKTSTEVGAGEGTAGMMARLKNVFGGGETLEGTLSAGTRTRRAFTGTLAAPLVWADPSVRTHAAFALTGVRRDNTSFASASEDVHTLRASVTTQALGRGTHELAYTAALRVVSDLAPGASYSMRRCAGPSTKSALTHSWVLDTQDDRIQGTAGARTRIAHELAGLGGDAAFYKAEAEHNVSRRVPYVSGVTWSLGARAGALLPLQGRAPLFPDRFQLGGPNSVRLFRANSLGPRDGSDSLGGDTFWAAGLSVVSDLPYKPHWPVKAHAFVNAGWLDSRDPGKTLGENARAMLAQPAVAAGVGLVYRFDWIRVEANFGVPLAAAASDGARKGFQVGMGIDFL